MKKVLLMICLVMTTLGTFAQEKGDMAVGANLTYGTDVKTIAIGVKGQYNVLDNVRVEADFDYWLKKDGVSFWDIQANVQYLFKMADNFKLYPLAGIGYMGYKTDAVEMSVGGVTVSSSSSSGGDVFFTLGGGVQYDLTEKVAVSGELKYQFKDGSQLCICAGVAYKF